jgi:2-polyprenyl-3-methyl-5-hydroxy-6-metoxy-1,4-benzoquinol methylase
VDDTVVLQLDIGASSNATMLRKAMVSPMRERKTRMDANAMEPLGRALLAYFEGDREAQLVIHRDDGVDEPMPISHFFRDPSEFTEVENKAIELCSGRVLDAGAGTGLHSVVLQQKGLPVTAIDISPQAVDVMSRRGVSDAHAANIYEFEGGPFGTVLMMGHGIGMVETIDGLDRFLDHTRGLVSEGGQLLLDSRDVRRTDDPSHLAYHETNRKAGRYIGEIRLHLSFREVPGPRCGWLHVDAETLAERGIANGWTSEVVLEEEDCHYLARLRKR